MSMTRSSFLLVGAPLLVLPLLLAFAGTAVAGGDEGHAPPSAGPPSPWDDREVGEGEDVPYKPTDARSCRLDTTRNAGPGSVLGAPAPPARPGGRHDGPQRRGAVAAPAGATAVTADSLQVTSMGQRTRREHRLGCGSVHPEGVAAIAVHLMTDTPSRAPHTTSTTDSSPSP
jgi:hypothetical protein